MNMRVQLLVMATLAFAAAAFAQDDAFQVRYASNINIGDSVINLTNAGTETTAGGFASSNICANVYTFDPAEELVACCSCLITPNALASLSVRNDLISNTLTPGVPTSVVVKLIASDPVGGTCNAAAPVVLAAGMRAWGTTIHALPTSPVTYGVTETEFAKASLSDPERARMTAFCGFIQANGSGFGICRSCRFGGLGAAKE